MRLSQQEGDLRLLAKRTCRFAFASLALQPAGRRSRRAASTWRATGQVAQSGFRKNQEKKTKLRRNKQASITPDALLAGGLWPALTHPYKHGSRRDLWISSNRAGLKKASSPKKVGFVLSDVTATDADALEGLARPSILIELAMPPVRRGAQRRGAPNSPAWCS